MNKDGFTKKQLKSEKEEIEKGNLSYAETDLIGPKDRTKI
jgi:hypothetical protein